MWTISGRAATIAQGLRTIRGLGEAGFHDLDGLLVRHAPALILHVELPAVDADRDIEEAAMAPA